MDNLIVGNSEIVSSENPNARSKLMERRLATGGSILYWTIVTIVFLIPTLFVLLMVTKIVGSYPRTIADEHRLEGALPSDFPRLIVHHETHSQSRSMDYVEFRTCTISSAEQVQDLHAWLNLHKAKQSKVDGIDAYKISGPAWFRESQEKGNVVWYSAEIDVGRSMPDSVVVGINEKRSQLHLIICRP